MSKPIQKKLEELIRDAAALEELALDLKASALELGAMLEDLEEPEGAGVCFVPGCRTGALGAARFPGNLLPCCTGHIGSDRAHYEALKILGALAPDAPEVVVTWMHPGGELETNKRGES